MMIVEETASAAPKGQANLVNSQAKEPQSDRTLERTPPRSDGVTDGEPVRANLSGRQDRDRGNGYSLSFFIAFPNDEEVCKVDGAKQDATIRKACRG